MAGAPDAASGQELDADPRYITIGAGRKHSILDRWYSSSPVASGLTRAGAASLCEILNRGHRAWLAAA